MKAWKTISRRIACQPNRFLSLEIHEIELPNGQRIDDWPWVVTPDYVNVLARTAEGKFICFRQNKYAVDGVSLAPVGGYVDEGEEPLAAAKRELLEESGYEAPTWQALGSYPVDANRGAGVAHLFLALDAIRVRSPESGDLEEQELLLFSREELAAALAAHEFKVLAWASVVALGMQALPL